MMHRALRLIRVYHDLNQAEAATRVGLSKSYVSEIETGNKKVTLEVLEKYASAFEIPLSSLMLFAENLGQQHLTEKTRLYVANKVLKMLDWIETISSDKGTNMHG